MNKKIKISKIIIILAILILIILMLFCGYSMAKMIDDAVVKASAQIAEPIIYIESTPAVDITAENNIGIYNFKIKNYDENNKITQTNLNYYIQIDSNLYDSINIELYKNDNIIELDNGRTQYMTLSKDKKEEDDYKIKIEYDKNKTNVEENILEKIQVKVHTEQAKA